jgi:hypothetical protein
MPSAVAFAAIVAMPRLDEVRRAQTAVASPRVAEARAKLRASAGDVGQSRFSRAGTLKWIPIFLRWRDDLGRRRVRGALVNWRDRVLLTHDAG